MLRRENKVLPYFSRNLSAFSKKDGPPSISSSASKIGRPTTRDLIGRLSLPGLYMIPLRCPSIIGLMNITIVLWRGSRDLHYRSKIIVVEEQGRYWHWWKEPSDVLVSFVSLLNIPLCPMTRAALGACARACSRAVFHLYKSSEVSAWNIEIEESIRLSNELHTDQWARR